jgi:nucleobase transporter 1/2
MGTIFFVSGLNTLIQTTFGDRLPIVQGGSFAFLGATFGTIGQIAADPKWCINAPSDDERQLSECLSEKERFLETICTVQGSIIVVGLVQIAMGYSGIMCILVKYISPVTIAPTVAMVGLGLSGMGVMGGMQNCEWLTFLVIVLMTVFSQMCGKIEIPIPGGIKLKIFELFPVILTIMVAWIIASIVEAAGGMDGDDPTSPPGKFAGCKTKVFEAEAFRVPYPGQWGTPIFKSISIRELSAVQTLSELTHPVMAMPGQARWSAPCWSRWWSRSATTTRVRSSSVPRLRRARSSRAALAARAGACSCVACLAPPTVPPRTARTLARSA